MTPAEEDALIRAACEPMQTIYDNKHREAIRLAIRAAVAQERERCARVCEEQPSLTVAVISETATGGFLLGCAACAAAIRRGE